MFVTRFLLSFLGFYLCYSISWESDGCEYQVNVSISQFIHDGRSLMCCWHFWDICSGCNITAVIFPKLENPVHRTLLPEANVTTLTTYFPAESSSFAEIELEFQVSQGSGKEVCSFPYVNALDHSENQWKSPYGEVIVVQVEPLRSGQIAGEEKCEATMLATFILHCPTTTTQATPTGTMTNTTDTVIPLNSSMIMMTSPITEIITPGLVQSSSPATKQKETTESNMWVWSIMTVAYFIAGITISVEVVYCCKMYRRSKSFPWCHVRLRRVKSTNVDNGLNNGSNKSVTICLEQTPPPPKNPARKTASKTVWIELYSQKEK